MSDSNREQIIKALECCHSHSYQNCPKCPYNEDTEKTCFMHLMEDALSLINKLTEDNEWSAKRIIEADKKVAKLTDENERLRAEKEAVNKESFYKWKKLADETADRYEGLYQDAKKSLVADTVRKMHSEIKERCIKGGIYPAFVASTIDQIEKEMLEGK